MSIIQFIIASALLLSALASFIQLTSSINCRDQGFINATRLQLLQTVDSVNPVVPFKLRFNRSCRQFLGRKKNYVKVVNPRRPLRTWRLNFALSGKVSNQ